MNKIYHYNQWNTNFLPIRYNRFANVSLCIFLGPKTKVRVIWIKFYKKIRITTTTYRSYKHFDENKFISDIANNLDEFAADKSSIDEDLNIWYSFLLKHLNNHAPIKSKRVKSKRMPDWFTPDII